MNAEKIKYHKLYNVLSELCAQIANRFWHSFLKTNQLVYLSTNCMGLSLSQSIPNPRL